MTRRLVMAASAEEIEAPQTVLRDLASDIESAGSPDTAPVEEDAAAEPTIDALKQQVEHLRAALASRDLIWEAKLVIAAAMGCHAEEAHRLLVQQSQHENRKLREIAADIVARSRV